MQAIQAHKELQGCLGVHTGTLLGFYPMPVIYALRQRGGAGVRLITCALGDFP
jgi:hypothetical protein